MMFDFLLAPLVIARRIERLSPPAVLPKSSARQISDAIEVQRMLSEKVMALQLGMLGSSAAVLSSATAVANRMMQGDALGASIAVADTPRKMLAAGFGPASTILKANANRLSAK